MRAGLSAATRSLATTTIPDGLKFKMLLLNRAKGRGLMLFRIIDQMMKFLENGLLGLYS